MDKSKGELKLFYGYVNDKFKTRDNKNPSQKEFLMKIQQCRQY